MQYKKTLIASSLASLLVGCGATDQETQTITEIYGTKEPFAKEAVYFVMTDRFVDGDSANNYEDQGGDYPTFGGLLEGPDGKFANVGYMGGDLKGVLNNADFIADMGFTAVWLTPIVDNPDEAFAGGEPITFGGAFKDGGKTGYHGYWANNFYVEDEHYVSEDLDYKTYTRKMREKGLKSVFDIVGNHGSPSFSMPVDQPKFGELYDINNTLVADHQNLKPEALDPNNPLHAFYHNFEDIMQLSNLNEENEALRDYMIGSYLHWIEQGADAFRIDTIKHVPHGFWKEVADRVRKQYPDFYMFGESFSYDANFIAQHTLEKNGSISVLDFPMQSAFIDIFQKGQGYERMKDVLYLTHGPYNNPYDLTTFYDNHDMPRMDGTDEAFINANNWLFTARGIPVVYQGSEMGFMRGTAEHQGNRNFYGQENIELAKQHIINANLSKIANVRKSTPALQRGLQWNIAIEGDTASFYRVLQEEDIAQTALVLLNKGDLPAEFIIDEYMQSGQWVEQLTGETISLNDGDSLATSVAANGVQVWVREGLVSDTAFEALLVNAMSVQ